MEEGHWWDGSIAWLLGEFDDPAEVVDELLDGGRRRRRRRCRRQRRRTRSRGKARPVKLERLQPKLNCESKLIGNLMAVAQINRKWTLVMYVCLCIATISMAGIMARRC